MPECLFCKIANKEIKADIIHEDKEVLVFRNIKPEAPIHLLFIPKKHIEWQNKFTEEDLKLLIKLISAAKQIAIQEKISQAYKLIFNIGKTGHISHIHLHLLGGWKEKIPMHNV